jgi:hypothetical protein
MISAVVLAVVLAMVLATGGLWLFLLQFPLANLCMCVLFARTANGPNPLVAQLAAEVVVIGGTGASTLWFLTVLRRLGLRFAAA